MAKFTFKYATELLVKSPNNISCMEMRKLLEDLGFAVRRGKNGNHHTYSHPRLVGFPGGNYDCGHGSKMLPVYPKLVLKALNGLQEDLEALFKEASSNVSPDKGTKVGKK